MGHEVGVGAGAGVGVDQEAGVGAGVGIGTAPPRLRTPDFSGAFSVFLRSAWSAFP